eukprot:jgi/Mesvir1/11814/Mv00171-RA.1
MDLNCFGNWEDDDAVATAAAAPDGTFFAFEEEGLEHLDAMLQGVLGQDAAPSAAPANGPRLSESEKSATTGTDDGMSNGNDSHWNVVAEDGAYSTEESAPATSNTTGNHKGKGTKRSRAAANDAKETSPAPLSKKTDQKEDALQRRLVRNRELAAESRERKKLQLTRLTLDNKGLRTENDSLKYQLYVQQMRFNGLLAEMEEMKKKLSFVPGAGPESVLTPANCSVAVVKTEPLNLPASHPGFVGLPTVTEPAALCADFERCWGAPLSDPVIPLSKEAGKVSAAAIVNGSHALWVLSLLYAATGGLMPGHNMSPGHDPSSGGTPHSDTVLSLEDESCLCRARMALKSWILRGSVTRKPRLVFLRKAQLSRAAPPKGGAPRVRSAFRHGGGTGTRFDGAIGREPKVIRGRSVRRGRVGCNRVQVAASPVGLSELMPPPPPRVPRCCAVPDNKFQRMSLSPPRRDPWFLRRRRRAGKARAPKCLHPKCLSPEWGRVHSPAGLAM